MAHEQRVILRSCVMRVREGGRRRAIREGQRNVHAWVAGELTDVVDGELIEIGYSPFVAGTFTVRPDYAPVHEAKFVVLGRNGQTYAVL
ncbi:hypothetical protein [Microvirga tunisiensis]|uniref:Uncharacterized protein n=1 Tax=Microvirga tunisiensis TaxID=2108360 RepID=A0A5N7MHB4_9HYPH|nr:hypothetical protein [Microvirga tunisiensis]MPR07813.1 hypothetical protein [Microvirga tunisiensis]MPR26208.1 hypothetical protein [Microvirga tunisiensis]